MALAWLSGVTRRSVVITGSMMASPINREPRKCQARLTFTYNSSSSVENPVGTAVMAVGFWTRDAGRYSDRFLIAGEAFAAMTDSSETDYSPDGSIGISQ